MLSTRIRSIINEDLVPESIESVRLNGRRKLQLLDRFSLAAA